MAARLSTLPQLKDSDKFKTTLTGPYKLRVTKVVDISKPAQKPVEEVEEPEEEDKAAADKLNKSNARMIQLDLKDSRDQLVKAVETERIELLDKVVPNCLLNIIGPVDLRCGNIMLEGKHVVSLETAPKEEKEEQAKKKVKSEAPVVEESKIPVVEVPEDWDEEDEDDCIILD